MMNRSHRTNKVCGVYWLKQPVENITIKIKVKTRESVTKLPTLDDYQHNTDEENLDKLADDKISEHTFRWQEKVFSLWEVEKYSDEHNCISDTDLNYYDIIKDLNYEQKKVFTYVDSYCHSLPLPFDNKKFEQINILNLNICFEKFNLGSKILGDGDSSSMRHLFKSEENVMEENDHWSAMQVVLDCSRYNEDSKVIFREERVLLSLYHNLDRQYLVVTPDVNDIHTNPYTVDGVVGFEYGVELEMKGEAGEDMMALLKGLLNKWEKKHKKLLSFSVPPLGRKRFYLTFEIISAGEFDMNTMYIEYHMKIPDNMKSTGELSGRTHCTKLIQEDDINHFRYGHTMELELECATGIEPQSLKIYLEAISVDWWSRHRTEGYSYLALTLQPGCYKDRLSCSRPEEINHVVADTRRFFVGGCHLIKDLNVLDNPQLKLPLHVYGHRRRPMECHIPDCLTLPSPPAPHSSSSALLSGADAVLKQYRKAKATLAMATGLNVNGSGDGQI